MKQIKDMTYSELLSICNLYGIKVDSKLTRLDLIKMVKTLTVGVGAYVEVLSETIYIKQNK